MTASEPPVSAPVVLSRRGLDAALFDLDGVVTRTARVYAEAWTRLFDAYLPHQPFTAEVYQH